MLSTCMIGGMIPLPASAEETVSENIVQTECIEKTENLENAPSEDEKSSETVHETGSETESETPDQGENTETPDQPEEPSQDEPPAADEQPAVQSEPAPQAAEAAEAAVAEVDGVNYDDIQKAFYAVKQSNGCTLTLLANCKTPDTSKPFDISGNYTLDLNGCTLTGRLYLSETSTSLTVMDSSTGGKIQATGSWSPLWVYGGDVTIESGPLPHRTRTRRHWFLVIMMPAKR